MEKGILFSSWLITPIFHCVLCITYTIYIFIKIKVPKRYLVACVSVVSGIVIIYKLELIRETKLKTCEMMNLFIHVQL